MIHAIKQIAVLWQEAFNIWLSGGSWMIAIAINAVALFALGTHLSRKLHEKEFDIPESAWRQWIDNPAGRRGAIGKILNSVTRASSFDHSSKLFQEFRAAEVVPFERDLRLMKICVTTAPLLGLLGTVTGMLITFGALAYGSGGEKTMGLISKGISEALITTETGLIVALPGLIFQLQLARRHERYKSFIDHIETVCNQYMYKKLRNQSLEV